MYLLINMLTVAIWFLYSLFIKITKKRKYDYSIVISFVFLSILIYMYFYNMYSLEWYPIYTLCTIGALVLWLIIDNIILLFSRNISGEEFKKIKKRLNDISSESELIRRRFISTIDLSFEGILFRENNEIFATDKAVKYLGINTNEMTIEMFYKKMHNDDVHEYQKTIDKLTKKYPKYSIKYRVKINEKYTWILENGTAIFNHNNVSYISMLKPIDLRLYPRTESDVLNEMEDSKFMMQEMQRLTRIKSNYYFVIISLTNIPKINEKFGRDFGDLMMGEYLQKIQFKFIKDQNSLYRISGINFGLIIKDKTKYDILTRALVGQGELIALHMKFGGVDQSVFPNIGIAEALYGEKSADIVYEQAKRALERTYDPKYDKSYCLYNK